MNIFKKSLITILLIAGSLSVQAELVFNEDFTRANSNKVDNGWLEINKNRNDVRIINGALVLRDNKKGKIDSGVAHKFDFEVSNLTLSFDWKPLLSADRKDLLNVSWATTYSTVATNWQTLFTTGLGANDKQWNTAQISSEQMAALSGLNSFYLLFWVDLGPTRGDEYKEGVRLDNIQLTNTATTSPIPLPSTILFFATGLAGLLAPRKLKKIL